MTGESGDEINDDELAKSLSAVSPSEIIDDAYTMKQNRHWPLFTYIACVLAQRYNYRRTTRRLAERLPKTYGFALRGYARRAAQGATK